MKNPSIRGQQAANVNVGLLATKLRPKPYSGFFRIKDWDAIASQSLKYDAGPSHLAVSLEILA
jgi:hypothetical protein